MICWKTRTLESLYEFENLLKDRDARFVYLRTLKHDPAISVLCLGDFLAAPPKNKKTKDLQEALLDNESFITDLIAPIVIPFETSGSAYEMMRHFIRDYIQSLQKVFVNKGGKDYDLWKITAMKLRYLWETPKDDVELDVLTIASVIGKNRESVRKQTEILRDEGTHLLEGDEEYFGICASPEITAIFREFKKGVQPVVILPILQKKLGSGGDTRTLKFFLEGMGYKCATSYCVHVPTLGEDALSRLNKMTNNGFGGDLVRYLKNEAIPLAYETDVHLYMRTELHWDERDCILMKAYLKANTDEFEWTQADGDELIEIKWEHLDAVDSRIANIVFRFNQQNGWNSSIGKAEIIKRYNHLADRFKGVEKLTHNINIPPDHEHIELIGNAQYRYCANRPTREKVNIAEKIKQFVAQLGGIAEFSKVRDFVFSINPSYAEQTIRQTFIPNAGCKTIVKKQINYVLNQSYIDLHPEISAKVEKTKLLQAVSTIEITANILSKERRPLRIKEDLIPKFKVVSKLDGFSVAAYKRMLLKAENTVFQLSNDGHTILLLLTPDELSTFDFDYYAPKRPGRKVNEFKSIIRSLAIDKLLYAPDHTLPKRELVNLVKDQYPEDKSISGIYAILNQDEMFISSGDKPGSSYTLNVLMYNKEHGITSSSLATPVDFNWVFIKESIVKQLHPKNPNLNEKACDSMYKIVSQDKPFSQDNEFWRILRLLESYYKGTASDNDKELLAYKLFLGLENYLVAYSRVPQLSDQKEGLKYLIDYLQQNGDLPEKGCSRFSPYGSISYEIDRTTGLMIVTRNKICHTLNRGQNKKENIEQNIITALKYYLFVAAYGSNNHS